MAGLSMPGMSMGPTMAVPSILIYGLIFVIIILAFFLIMLLIGQKDIPSIKVIIQAMQKKKAIVVFHFSDGSWSVLPPELDKEEAKISPNYYRTRALLKFWDSSGQAAERLDGIIPTYNIFMNMPEAVAVRYAALLYEIEKTCRDWGVPWDGIQDLVFYALAEVDAAKKEIMDRIKKNGFCGTDDELDVIARTQALENTLKYIHIDDEASKERVKIIVDFVYDNSDLINRKLSKPIQFQWNTVIRAWDSLTGLTSRNVEQIKICAEELAKLDGQGNNDKWILIAAIAFVIVIGGIFVIGKAAKWI